MPADAGRGRAVVLVVAAGVVALAVVAGVWTWRVGSGGSSGLAATRPVTVVGAALPELPDRAAPDADPARGRPIPEIRGAAFGGAPVAVKGDGKPKVLVLVAHWCPHCQAEVPRLVTWLAGGGVPAGVQVQMISTAVEPSRPNYPPAEWLTRERWPTPVMADDDKATAARALGLSGFPFFVFVAADGTVAGRHAGALSIDALTARVAPLAAK